MIKFKKLFLKNTRLYEGTTINLENQGLVSITGQNGAGKSFLWGVLESIFWGSSPNGESWETFADIKKPSTEIHIDFSKDDSFFEIVISRRNEKWKVRIFKNGEDITPHSQVDAKRNLKNILNLNRQEFQGSVHLTQGNQHILIEGKPSERKQYISEFFGLDNSYDTIWQNSKKEIQKIRHEINRLENDLAKTSILYGEIEKLKTSVKDNNTLREEVADKKLLLDEIASDLFAAENSTKQAEQKEIIIKALSAYPNPAESLHTKKQKINEIKEFDYILNEVTSINKKAEDNNKKIYDLKKIITEIEEKIPKCYLDSSHEMLITNLIKLEESKKNYEHNIKIKNKIDLLPQGQETSQDELLVKKAELSEKKIEFATIKKRIDDLKDGNCPTCGKKTTAKSIEGMKKDLDNLHQEISNLHTHVQNLDRDWKITKEKSELTSLLKESSWEDKNFKEMEYLKLASECLINYHNAKNILPSLSPMELTELPKKTDDENIAALESEINWLENLLAKKELLSAEINKSSVDYREISNKLREQKSSLQKDYENTLSILNNSMSAEANISRIKQEINSFGDVIGKITEQKKQENLLCAIEQAYGNQGLRLLRLKRVMKFVMTRLPYYTSRLFSEKGLTFEAKCESGSVEIIAKRVVYSETGEVLQTITHDISALSGGEKKRLSVALVLALADCVPDKKKSNMLILDEIDANLDTEGQHLFGTELLPGLKERYESIFVISHSEGMQQSAHYDQFWKINKLNHSSQISVQN
jgi:DNA repair exonuclease SbcCD ATPase subunit